MRDNKYIKSSLLSERAYDSRVRRAYRAARLYADALNDLSDVNTSGAETGSILEYDDVTKLWRAVSKKHIGFLYTSGLYNLSVSSSSHTLTPDQSMKGVIVISSTLETTLVFSKVEEDQFYCKPNAYDSRVTIVDCSASSQSTSLAFPSGVTLTGSTVIKAGEKSVLYWNWNSVTSEWNVHSVIITSEISLPALYAGDIIYDNDNSSLLSTSVQGAVDELDFRIQQGTGFYLESFHNIPGNEADSEILDLCKTGTFDGPYEINLKPSRESLPESWKNAIIGQSIINKVYIDRMNLDIDTDTEYDGILVSARFNINISEGNSPILITVKWTRVDIEIDRNTPMVMTTRKMGYFSGISGAVNPELEIDSEKVECHWICELIADSLFEEEEEDGYTPYLLDNNNSSVQLENRFLLSTGELTGQSVKIDKISFPEHNSRSATELSLITINDGSGSITGVSVANDNKHTSVVTEDNIEFRAGETISGNLRFIPSLLKTEDIANQILTSRIEGADGETVNDSTLVLSSSNSIFLTNALDEERIALGTGETISLSTKSPSTLYTRQMIRDRVTGATGETVNNATMVPSTLYTQQLIRDRVRGATGETVSDNTTVPSINRTIQMINERVDALRPVYVVERTSISSNNTRVTLWSDGYVEVTCEELISMSTATITTTRFPFPYPYTSSPYPTYTQRVTNNQFWVTNNSVNTSGFQATLTRAGTAVTVGRIEANVKYYTTPP